jgi:hypothetical protein
VKGLCNKNYKISLKEIKAEMKDMPCSWTGSISIVKMSVLLKAIFRFSAVPIKMKNGDTEHVRRNSTSPVTREVQIKVIMRYPSFH